MTACRQSQGTTQFAQLFATPLFCHCFNNGQRSLIHFMHSPFPYSLFCFMFCLQNCRVCFVVKQRTTKSPSTAFLFFFSTEGLLFQLTGLEMALKIHVSKTAFLRKLKLTKIREKITNLSLQTQYVCICNNKVKTNRDDTVKKKKYPCGTDKIMSILFAIVYRRQDRGNWSASFPEEHSSRFIKYHANANYCTKKPPCSLPNAYYIMRVSSRFFFISCKEHQEKKKSGVISKETFHVLRHKFIRL